MQRLEPRKRLRCLTLHLTIANCTHRDPLPTHQRLHIRRHLTRRHRRTLGPHRRRPTLGPRRTLRTHRLPRTPRHLRTRRGHPTPHRTTRRILQQEDTEIMALNTHQRRRNRRRDSSARSSAETELCGRMRKLQKMTLVLAYCIRALSQ